MSTLSSAVPILFVIIIGSMFYIVHLILFNNALLDKNIIHNTDIINENANKMDNKCLIIIFGQVRAFELTYDSFKKYVLSVTNCDLALCVGTYHGIINNNPFYENSKYIWIWNETQFGDSDYINNLQKWFDYLVQLTIDQNPNLLIIKHNITEWKTDWKKLYEIKGDWLGPLSHSKQSGAGAILIFLRQFLYFKLKELNLIHEYKYFMLTRSDYKYLCDFPMKKLTNNYMIRDKIWITSGQECDGVTDRNLLTSNELFLDTLNIAMDLFINYDKWFQKMQSNPYKSWNIEMAIKQHLEFKNLWINVESYKQMMFLVRSNNTFSRYSIGEWDETQQLFIKYKLEYTTSLKTCYLSL